LIEKRKRDPLQRRFCSSMQERESCPPMRLNPPQSRSRQGNLHHYFKFRDGKVCFSRSSEDTALVAAALTP
jgi:hypothetical protein